jgi:hypothetical protein
MSFVSSTVNWRLYEFLELFNLEKKLKRGWTVTGPEPAQGSGGSTWHSGQIGPRRRRGRAGRAWSPRVWAPRAMLSLPARWWLDDRAIFTTGLSMACGRVEQGEGEQSSPEWHVIDEGAAAALVAVLRWSSSVKVWPWSTGEVWGRRRANSWWQELTGESRRCGGGDSTQHSGGSSRWWRSGEL